MQSALDRGGIVGATAQFRPMRQMPRSSHAGYHAVMIANSDAQCEGLFAVATTQFLCTEGRRGVCCAFTELRTALHGETHPSRRFVAVQGRDALLAKRPPLRPRDLLRGFQDTSGRGFAPETCTYAQCDVRVVGRLEHRPGALTRRFISSTHAETKSLIDAQLLRGSMVVRSLKKRCAPNRSASSMGKGSTCGADRKQASTPTGRSRHSLRSVATGKELSSLRVCD
eukprot:scaffold7916_cov286-Pinguiococcus_pyrenoidosus.AAC.4